MGYPSGQQSDLFLEKINSGMVQLRSALRFVRGDCSTDKYYQFYVGLKGIELDICIDRVLHVEPSQYLKNFLDETAEYMGLTVGWNADSSICWIHTKEEETDE